MTGALGYEVSSLPKDGLITSLLQEVLQKVCYWQCYTRGKRRAVHQLFLLLLFFFSLLLVTPQTHPRRHTYTYMRNSPFPVLLCSQSSFPINPVYLRQLFEVILYGSRLHLFCGALNGHFWVVNNRASLCGVWSVNTHSSVTGSYLIVSPVSPNPHRELFAFFSVILKDVY